MTMPETERVERNNPAAGHTGLNWLLVILLILLTAFLVRGQASLGPSPERPIAARGDLAEDEKATIDIFRRASPSVVHITNIAAVRRDLFRLDATGVPQGTGSGVVWDSAGYIVTNYHVIETAEAVKVTLADRSEWDARLVGTAPDKDIAVLKIEAPAAQLRPIAIGTSANLQVGQKVFAIGNPFGLDQTLTNGIVSQVGREILSATRRPIQGVIQTNASINPGNSGGPLLDSAGLMIGINTAIYSTSGFNSGIGFAVPIDTVNWIVPQLIRHGKVERVGMGISIWEDHLVSRLGIRGVVVREVSPGSPAADAGLVATRQDASGTILGDVIVAINGRPVEDSLDLYRLLDQHKAGETVTVSVERVAGRRDLKVTLRVLE